MCYRFRIHYGYVVFLAAMIYMLSTWAADEPDELNSEDVRIISDETSDSDAAKATEHVIGVYYAYSAERTEIELLKSGLAKPEVDHVVDAVAKGYAECIVTSFQKTNNYESAFAIEMIADGAAMRDVSMYMKSLSVPGTDDPLAVFDVEAGACLDSLDASYGLK